MSFPQTRKLHNYTEGSPGRTAVFDPNSKQKTLVAAAAIEFGQIVTESGTNEVTNPGASSTSFAGIALADSKATNFDSSAFAADDLVPVGLAGYFYAKIDVDNKPTARGSVKVSYATGKVGYLTSQVVQSREIGADQGIEIVEVLDTVAVVYLSGNPKMTISAAEVAS